MKKYIIIGCLIIATVAVAQDQTSCEDKLLAVKKEVIILKVSREQTESSMAAVWSRLEKSESELAKLKIPQKE